jgi:hypothetical protein
MITAWKPETGKETRIGPAYQSAKMTSTPLPHLQ